MAVLSYAIITRLLRGIKCSRKSIRLQTWRRWRRDGFIFRGF